MTRKHTKSHEEINYFIIRAGLEYCAVNKARGHTLSSKEKTKYQSCCFVIEHSPFCAQNEAGMKQGKLQKYMSLKATAKKQSHKGTNWRYQVKLEFCHSLTWKCHAHVYMNVRMHAVQIWLPHAQIIHTKLVVKSLKRLLQRRELRLEEQVSELQQQKATQNARVCFLILLIYIYISYYCRI